MAKSVLELAVGTGQWNAGLKKAKSALDNFTQAQGGVQAALEKDSGKIGQFVQMMGKMESTAKTAKGQMNDYKSTIEQLTMQYNRMTDAQKKTVGQDYLQAIDQMKQKYQAVNDELQEMNRTLNQTKTAEDGSGLFGGGKLDGMLQVMGGNLMTKGVTMVAGAAMSMANEIGDAVKQGIELAKQGEGIRIAFERLGRGDILDGLREATHGTVTDLELMKAAVKFNDFRLPVEELGTMLAFAQQKAKDTGQSIDYMVDSIVTGLGRKSLMILDNLGLSAAEIKEKMAETGDMTKAVGEIIRDQMAKAGDYVETAADRAAKANVSLQNKMEELGRKFAPLEEASSQFWTSMKIGILDVVGGPLTNLLNKLTQAGRLMNAYGQMGGSGKVGRLTANLAGASEGNRQSIYRQQQEQFWRYINPRKQQIRDIRAWQRGERGEALQGRINAITQQYGSLDATKIQAEVDAAKKMLSDYQQAAKTILKPAKVDIDTNDASTNIDDLKNKLKDLEEQRRKAIKAGDTELSKSLLKQINQTKADIKGLDPTALKTGGKKNSIYGEGTIEAQEKLVADLTKKWKEAGDAVRDDYALQLSYAKQQLAEMTGGFNPSNVRPIADMTGRIPTPDFTADYKKNKGRWYDATAPVAPSEIKFSDGLQKLMDYIQKTQQDDFRKRQNRSALGDTKDVVSGLGQVASGLQQMGIQLPEEVNKVLGVINGLMTVIEGVNTIIGVTQTANLTANTIALGALTSAIYANTVTNMIPFFAGGGIVPHAANGYFVPGTRFSGDHTPIMANAGELILNRAQQGSLAGQLQGTAANIHMTASVQGEQIILAANNTFKRKGKGELVTWKN